MDRYFYLILALCFIALAGVIYLLRPDLRTNLLALAVIGAAWGPISEHWFFLDYWRPLSVVRGAWLEDCLYGAGIAASAGTLYKVVLGQRLKASVAPRRLWILPLSIALYTMCMLLFQGVLHVNSIYVSMGVYTALTGLMLTMRPDLFLASAGSGFLMTLIALTGYSVGLDFLVDGKKVLREIWLLDGTSAGVTILGMVPLSEVLWYACWGFMLGIAFEFATGAGTSRSVRPQGQDCGGVSSAAS